MYHYITVVVFVVVVYKINPLPESLNGTVFSNFSRFSVPNGILRNLDTHGIKRQGRKGKKKRRALSWIDITANFDGIHYCYDGNRSSHQEIFLKHEIQNWKRWTREKLDTVKKWEEWL